MDGVETLEDTSANTSEFPVVIDARRKLAPGKHGPVVQAAGRHAFAIASMAIGTAGVLALVAAMNSAVQPPKADATASAASFTVERKPPPEKQRTREPKPAKKVKSSNVARAPLPDLGTAVAGVTFDLPAFETANLSGASQTLLADANRKTAMTADAVDDPPKPRVRVQPEYPDKARERGIKGFVTMRVKVSAEGDVSSVRVVESNPRGMFDQVAVAAMRQWEFEPGMYEGAPVDIWVNQTLRFELN